MTNSGHEQTLTSGLLPSAHTAADQQAAKFLEHVLECDICLTVIADCRVSVDECEFRCEHYRALKMTAEAH